MIEAGRASDEIGLVPAPPGERIALKGVGLGPNTTTTSGAGPDDATRAGLMPELTEEREADPGRERTAASEVETDEIRHGPGCAPQDGIGPDRATAGTEAVLESPA